MSALTHEPATFTVTGAIHLARRGRGGRKEVLDGQAPVIFLGRVPRVARLMALAIRFDRLIREGTVADYAELARLGRVTRARISQIMSLLNLASDIQEELLNLPRVLDGRDRLVLRHLLPITACIEWKVQRQLFDELMNEK
jgi:hypothetical protein